MEENGRKEVEVVNVNVEGRKEGKKEGSLDLGNASLTSLCIMRPPFAIRQGRQGAPQGRRQGIENEQNAAMKSERQDPSMILSPDSVGHSP